MPNSHEVSLRQKRTDEHLLKGEYIRSERYAGHTPKYEGTHSYLASQSLSLTLSHSISLSEGDPYKRLTCFECFKQEMGLRD